MAIQVKIEVFDNFIKEKNIFNDIKNLLMANDFPYYYYESTAYEKDKSDFFFSHIMYDKDKQESKYFNTTTMPILGRLKFNYLERVKVNCYTKKHKQVITGMHTDMPQKHMVALFSINNNNGYTLFENGDKILSKENQLILFNGDLKHCSVAQTDENVRINININLS